MGAKIHLKRRPAISGKQVVDPAAWKPHVLAQTDDWKYTFNSGDIAEISAAVDAVQAQGLDLINLNRDSFHSPRFHRF